jgi:peptide/nickel transport system permease protein
LSDSRIRFGYVGRNAVLPLVTQLAVTMGFIVGGSIFVETFFKYPGIGSALFAALQSRDYTVLQGIFLIITVSVIVANLLADILYSRLDPRVRVASSGGASADTGQQGGGTAIAAGVAGGGADYGGGADAGGGGAQ